VRKKDLPYEEAGDDTNLYERMIASIEAKAGLTSL
jgi:hypothetical protein